MRRNFQEFGGSARSSKNSAGVRRSSPEFQGHPLEFRRVGKTFPEFGRLSMNLKNFSGGKKILRTLEDLEFSRPPKSEDFVRVWRTSPE